MPTLSITGQLAEFQAFWCDTTDPGPGKLGLVVLAFAQPFPGDWALAVTSQIADRQHLLALWEWTTSPSPRSLLGIPIPAGWGNFELKLTPFSRQAVGAAVPLRFAR